MEVDQGLFRILRAQLVLDPIYQRGIRPVRSFRGQHLGPEEKGRRAYRERGAPGLAVRRRLGFRQVVEVYQRKVHVAQRYPVDRDRAGESPRGRCRLL